jgi:hypothetical protein
MAMRFAASITGKRAVGKTVDGIEIRFTQKNSTLYATLMGELNDPTVVVPSLKLRPGNKGSAPRIYELLPVVEMGEKCHGPFRSASRRAM